jgi:hypothetical protein
LVCGGGDIITTGGTDILYDCIDWDIRVKQFIPINLIIYDASLNRTSPGTIYG